VGHLLNDLDDVKVERGVVVAYGAMIPESTLNRVPMLNVHFSLLPRWRGAAPVQRAILAGDEETGVAIISLEKSLDTGPIHLERRVSIEEKSAEVLTNELAHVGASALLEVLASPELLNNPRVQVGDATYAEKLTKETMHLSSTSRELFLRTVRLGGAFLFVDAKRLRVTEVKASAAIVAESTIQRVESQVVAGTGDGAVTLIEVRPEGSRTMAATAWWAGLNGANDERSWS
jgi:methionyl-tRNA formyltransferase